MKKIYYIIALTDKRNVKSGNDSEWPKLIAYSPKSQKLLLQEGCGHGLMGGTINIDSPNLDDWKVFFEDADFKWFFDKVKLGDINELTSKDKFIEFLDEYDISEQTIEY